MKNKKTMKSSQNKKVSMNKKGKGKNQVQQKTPAQT